LSGGRFHIKTWKPGLQRIRKDKKNCQVIWILLSPDKQKRKGKESKKKRKEIRRNARSGVGSIVFLVYERRVKKGGSSKKTKEKVQETQSRGGRNERDSKRD